MTFLCRLIFKISLQNFCFFALLCLNVFFSVNSQAAGQATTVTLDGQLLQAGTSQPLLDSAVRIKVQILDPSKKCLLYEEQQTVNTSSSNGYYSIQMGSAVGDAKRTGSDPGLSMTQVYQNTVAVTAASVPGQTCVASTYTPSARDKRYLRVTVTPSSTNVADTLSPDTEVGSVPSATVADTVQGYSPSQFVVTGTGDLTQANVQSVFATGNAAKLQTLLSFDPMTYVRNSGNGALPLPSVTGTPATPVAGQMWYDGGTIKFYNGSSTQSLGVSGAGITSLSVSSNLTAGGTAGGTLTAPGTIDLANSGVTAGTYPKVTVDAKGRVTSGASLVEGDLPTISTAGKVSGSAITSGTIAGSTAISTTGNISAANITSTNSSANNILLYETSNTKKITVKAPATGSLTADYSLTLPTTVASSNGQVLTSDTSGNLSWSSPTSGVTLAGDVSGAAGTTSVDKIKGVAVVPGAYAASQVLKYDGSNWVNAILSSTNLSNDSDLLKASNMPANCSANQTLTFSSPTGSWLCSSIAIDGTAFGSQTAGMVFAAPVGAAGTPTFRSLASTDFPSTIVVGNGDTSATPSAGTLRGTNASGTDVAGAALNIQGGAGTGAGAGGAITFNTSAAGSTGSSLNTLSERMRITSGGNVGIGTISPSAKLDISAGTVTANAPIINGTQTWNNAGTTFSAATINVTDTASAANSKLLDLQIGGASKFSVDKTGNITTSGNTVSSGNTTSTGNFATSGNISTTGTGTITSAGALTVSSGGASITGGVNNNSGGITNAGSITGVGGNITGAGAMTVAAGGTNQNITLSGSGTGFVVLNPNVGIGTSSPSYSLDVNSGSSGSTARFYGSQGSGTLVDIQSLGSGSGAKDAAVRYVGSASWTSGVDSSNNNFLIAYGANFPSSFSAANKYFNITSTGNVGVGTVTPANLLTLSKSDTSVYSASSSSASAPFTNGSSPVLTIDNLGNTDGIGSYIQLISRNGATTATQSYIGAVSGSGYSSTLTFGSRTGSTAYQEKMRIDGSGNVGIGTSSPVAKLQVGSAPTASANYGLLSLGSAPFDGATAGYFTGSSNGTVIAENVAAGYTGDLVNLQVAGSSKFKVDYQGNITSAGGTTLAANQNLTMSSGTGQFTQTYSGTGPAQSITSTGSGNIVNITTASTTAASGDKALSIAVSGANGTSNVTRYGTYSTVTATGTGSTNVAGYFSASGGANNYGLLVPNGLVGIGTSTPTALLDIRPDSSWPTTEAIQMTQVLNNPTIRLFRPTGDGTNAYPWYIRGGGYNVGNLEFASSGTSSAIGSEVVSTRMVLAKNGYVGVGIYTPPTFMSISPPYYSTGTAAQSGNTITGTGTTFTSAMVGAQFVFANGTSAGTITGYTDASTLTVSVSQTVSSQGFGIFATGLNVGGTTGYVGVGTASPAAVLDVKTNLGSIRTSGSGSYGVIQNFYDSTGNYTAYIANNGGSNELLQLNASGSNATGKISLQTNGTERMRIDNNGYVNIGTAGGSSSLHVMGTSTAGTAAVVQSKYLGTESTVGGQVGEKAPVFQVVGGDNNENSPGQISIMSLGVGANSNRGPGLYLVGTRSTSSQIATGTYSPLQSGDDMGHIQFGGDDGSNLRAGGTAPGGARIGALAMGTWSTTSRPADLFFLTTASGAGVATERMRITSAGNIGISTSTPVSKLHINNVPVASSNYGLVSIGSAPFDGATAGYFNGSAFGTILAANATSGYIGDLINFQTAGVNKFKVDGSGNITSAGTVGASGNISTTGNIATTGTGTITSAGNTYVTSGTASTSSTSGALVVTGGAGVSGTLNVGSALNANGNITTASGTAATSGANQSSPYLYLAANYWNGTASAVDQWSLQNILGSGTNPTSTLTFSHSGTSGTSQYAFLNANLGVGTSTPNALVHILGATAAGNYLQALNLHNTSFNNSGPGGVDLNFINDITSSNNVGAKLRMVRVGSYNQADLAIFTNNTGNTGDASTEKMRITSGGNVGVGTSTPIEALNVSGNVRVGRAPSSLTTLSAAATNSDTTLTVASTTNYPTSGTLLVDSEAITYTGTTSTTFTGLGRGAFGTTAAAHALSATVNIYLDTVVTSASIPKFSVLGSGSVAINTAVPTSTELFSVQLSSGKGTRIGNIGNDGTAALFLSSVATTQTPLVIRGFASQTADLVQIQDSSATSRLLVNSSGNVGINNSNPGTTLAVGGTYSQTGTSTTNTLFSVLSTLNANSATQNQLFQMQAGVVPQIDTNALYGMIFLPTISGSTNNITNVTGIYTRTDLGATYSGTVTNYSGFAAADPTISGGTITNVRGFVSGISSGANKYNIYASGTAQNYFAGNVGIGLSSPNSNLDVLGTTRLGISSSGDALVVTSGNTYVKGGGATGAIHFQPVNGTDSVVINASGNLGIGMSPSYQLQLSTDSAAKPGTSTWTIASDERLKDIRGVYSRGLASIDTLQPIYFNYKESNPLALPSDKEFVGIKAQDVQKVIPEAVSKDDQGYLHVTNDAVIWAMVNSIKELYHKMLNDNDSKNRAIASVQQENLALKRENEVIKAELKKRAEENEKIKSRLDRLEKALAR